MNEIIKKQGVNFGLILGALLAMVTVGGYAYSTEILVSYWALLYVFLVVIIMGLLVIGFSKRDLGGFISFKDAFTSYFIMLIIGMFISTLVNFLIFNVVDTDFKSVVQEKQIETIDNQREWIIGKMYDGNSSEDDIEKTNEKFDEAIEKIKSKDQYAIGEQIKGLFIGIAIMSVFGVLLALLLRRKDPSLE